MDRLARLRTLAPTTAGYDSLTDAEHVAVLDASELLDELRPLGYGFALRPDGTLKVSPPPAADKDTRERVVALGGALVYVLRIEASAESLPDACLACEEPVWQYSDNGFPYCETHFRVAKAKVLLRALDRLHAAPATESEEAAA
jgi:hypothetical protein